MEDYDPTNYDIDTVAIYFNPTTLQVNMVLGKVVSPNATVYESNHIMAIEDFELAMSEE